MFENTNVGIGVLRDRRIAQANRRLAAMFGYEPQEFIGLDACSMCSLHRSRDATAGAVGEQSFPVPAKCGSFANQVRFRRRDGTHFRGHCGLSKASLGHATNDVVWVVEDVTGRMQTEELLLQSEQKLRRFRVAMDATADAIYLVDRASMRFIDVNEAACRMQERTREELHVLGPEGVLSTPREELARIYDAVIAGGGRAKPVERQRLRKDGSPMWLEIHRSAQRSDQGWMIVTLVRDITERKQAEAAHVESQLAIAEARDRMSAIIDGSLDAIVSVDDAQRIVVFNRAAEQMFGIPAAEAIGQAIDRFIPERLRSRHRAHLDAFAQGGRTVRAMGQVSRLSALRQDGTEFPIEASISSVLSQGKKLFTATLRDITQREQTEAARISLEAQLRESQKMEAVGTLAGGIAHDFNNIIAAILGNAELARQDIGDNPRVQQSLEDIRKAGSRARGLVQQILTFSRKRRAERKRVALAPIVDECVHLLRATLPARLTLDVHCDTGVPAVLADVIQIEQVLINLATNAMQAMQGGPGHIGIQVDTVMLDGTLAGAHPVLRDLYRQYPGRTVRVTVSDDGSGMDAATMERIFEPFFTTKAADEGTGLGLSVVHGIVKAHNGAIEVASQPGNGSRFTIYLPAADAEIGAPEPTAEPAHETEALEGGQHIAYVDDDEALVSLVTRLLERRGLRVSGYLRADEALSALRADPGAFDLVVTDYNMPGMSGLDVARKVRAIRDDLPVVIASGFIDEVLLSQAAGAGVRELIFKADVVEDLCDAVQRLLKERD